MSRRNASTSPSPSSRPTKRQRVEHLTSESFKNGVMLAPMVRSGALPTRLFALKHGATLVWGPEIVDKAILHAERVVDPQTGVISYNGKSKAMFTTHPIEKPYLIYQIGSADPALAVQAAKMVMQDVSGIDLNCGCPKPFSTHAGMGAALLSTPDLLCSILTALREAMPPEITVSAKIRLLPMQEDTIKLVERIVNTGVSALTVHCRTRNMRPNERAVIERLREIVEFVEAMGKGVAVIANGDCLSAEDALRVKEITGAHSCMIATAAESNPTVFSPTPLLDLERTLMPSYIRLGKYLDNHFSSTKFSFMQFKGSHDQLKKSERKDIRDVLSRAKSYEDLGEFVGGVWDGEDEMKEIVKCIESRPSRAAEQKGKNLVDLAKLLTASIARHAQPKNVEATEEASSKPQELSLGELPSPAVNPADGTGVEGDGATPDNDTALSTPPDRINPEPDALKTPRMPLNEKMMPVPAMISGRDAPTPTPTPPTSQGAGGMLA